MKNIQLTKNEAEVVLQILKNPERDFNANNISKVIGITSMGALKIMKNLEQNDILTSRKIGNYTIYKINLKNEYAFQFVKFLLIREAQQSSNYVKRWVTELRKIKEAESAILFGSVLTKEEGARDMDVLFILKKNNFDALKKEINKLNELNEKNIHPIYQTTTDLKKNIIKEDRVILNAIKGIVAFGEDKFISLIKEIK